MYYLFLFAFSDVKKYRSIRLQAEAEEAEKIRLEEEDRAYELEVKEKAELERENAAHPPLRTSTPIPVVLRPPLDEDEPWD